MIKKISFLLLFVFAAFAAKAQTIDLVAPNGGENYATNSNQFIVWTSSGISNVKIEFSADGGTSWSLVSASVATTPGVGFYSWAVPAAPSTFCRVRISDVASPVITDISAANFSISSPTITLTSPNGGEIIGVGSNYNITWTGVGVSSVKLEYTVNNGSTWNTIINSVSAGSGSYTWAGVPNNPSTQCKIRITDISNPLVSDQSNNIFTIVVPSLVVTTPNGGETLTGATTTQIYWNSTGVSGNVTLKYTTDGTTWITISAFATNNGTFNWNVPNNTTACAKVAVIDNSNASVADTSNACFAINASPGVVTISAPNGGESWGVGSSRQITWSSLFITNVKIEYSTDNGATWTEITPSVSAGSGSYTWSPIPNTISSNCKIRVSDATNPAFFDVSNVIFSIVNPLATVTYPNGGESFVGNSSPTVYWSSLGLGSFVDLFYSIDGGSSWTQFAFSTSNDGNQSWTIPNLPSTTCKIRVRDTSFPNSEDVSDANFTITAPVPTITLTTPNGSENWSVGSSKNILWSSSNISLVNIDYSIDNGVTWIAIANNISASGGFYNWSSVPNTPSCIAKVRVTDASNALYFDASNNNFCITTPAVTVTTPNGGETFTASTSTTVFWNSAGLSTNVNIYYSTDGGATWTLFVSCTSNDGSQNWNIPATIGNQYRIKVEDCSSPFTFDISDANFTVVAPIPTIAVSTPNGGDIFGIGTNETISWGGTNLSNGVNLEYSLNNGSSWTVISTFTSGATFGNYTWLVPNVTPSTSCLVRVTSLLNGAVSDVSNSNFSIVTPSITLIDPNGGQTLTASSSYTIRYNTLELTGNIRLELSTDGGSTFPTTFTNTATGTSFNWTVNNIPSTQCRIRATSTTITSLTDVSDANFTILAPTPTVTQSVPNGGEFYTIGSNQTVSWSGSNLLAGVNLEYSLNSGSTWTTITTFTSGANGGSYNWLIPTVTPSTNCLFRVTSLANALATDVSNSNFTISNPIPAITVTAPNTNVYWGIGTAQTITWNCSNLGAGNLVNILMSYDNGASWTTLASSYTSGVSSGSYNLANVVGPVSATCLIRVEDAVNTAYFDQSNVLFNVANRQINVLAPNGGEVVYIGSFPTFSWSSLAMLGNVRILLSRDGGTTFPTTITNSVSVNSTSGLVTSSYGSWQAVAPTSTQCRIRVVDVSNGAIVDESNADFTIAVPVPSITVSSPNGGEVYGVASNSTISWNCSNLSTSNLVNIEYSTDNGTSWTSIVSSHTSFASFGSYNWVNIPNTPSANCKVRVSDVGFPTSNDVSNNTFSIVTPNVYVATPNGGEVFTALTNNTINWSSTGFTGNVDIAYKTTLGAVWTNIATNQTNNGSYNWSVPNTPTTTAKVRVRSTSFSAHADSSDVFFTINPPIKSITVSAPNGGEIYGVGTNKTISWSSSNVATVKIELSLDNGVTYPTTLTASTAAGAGSFSWNNIPNTPSNLCKIKITDISDPAVSDVSNNTFTIVNPALTISAPNGGETFVANSSYNISWFSQGASNNYRIEVSTDGGATYQMINANYFTPQQVVNYSWNISTGLTGLPSANCLVRVTDISGIAGAPLDVSDNLFTINMPPPIITVTTPNGGQNWVVGSNQNINWTASFVTSLTNLKVEYTTDNGLNWNLINASVLASNGSILWTVPNTPSSLCRIRISDAANPTTYFDLSNNVFNIISPSITLVTPNCGELWNGASNYSIFWSGTGLSGTVKLEYSINNGSTWNSITNFAGSSSTGGNYTWNVPNTPSTLALVRVTDNGTPSLVDVSNCNFTILSPNPYITVNYPNGGEQFGTNNNVNITWQSAYVSNVNIEYYNGSIWQSVATNISAAAGSYAWTTPGVANGAARIRLIDAANGSVSDQSNGFFTIVSPSVNVTSPNGFENLTAGNTHNITWNSIGLSNYVRIRLSTDGGTSYTVISNSEYNDGLLAWTVPNTPSTQCRVEISDYNNALVVDVSNSNFTISAAPASVTLTSPNGGQIYATGSTQNITWSSLSVSNVNIELSIDGGSNYTPIISNYAAALGSYSWIVPSTASDNCLIRISNSANSAVNDISSSVFEIAAPYITVTAPNGGNNLMVGNNYYITWASLGVPNVKVEFSTNGGTTWTTLAANTANVGYFYWNIPNQITTTAKIRVSNVISSVTDQSDADFSIINSTPSISLSSPNGGQYWYAGSSYYINWTSNGVSSVKLEYTVNNGVSWTDIVTSIPSITGYYYWNVPITPSTQCKVRISNAANSSLNDESNAVFTIASPTPYVQVNYPNGSENFNVGSFANITWTKNNINAVKVEISRNGGGSWTTLVTSTTANSYYWNVTAPNSTNCLVRVTDFNDANQLDISNGPFTISTTAVNTNTITTSAVATPICKGATIDVSFTQNGTFNVGNIYTAQLSDAFGNFTNPILIGSFSGITPSTMQCVIPTSIANGTAYRIRVVASDLPTVGANNGTDLIIKSPEFNFTASSQLKYLPDGQVDFTYVGVSSDIISYTWTFGNSETSTLQNPTYNYTQIGFYDISLTAINTYNCVTTLTKPTYIRVERLFTNTLLNSGTTSRITGASFINRDKGCFALENGNCIVTADSGATFQTSVTGATVGLTGASLKAGKWYVSGQNGTLLKSTNQGDTWAPIASAATGDLKSISFANADTGFVVGTNGVAMRVENGTAVPQTTGVSANLRGVSAIFDEAYAVGDNGTIVHFDGSSWGTMPSPTSDNFTSILMFELKATRGYACDDGGSIIRYEGGQWDVSLSGVDVDFKSIAGFGNDSAWVSATEGIVYVTYDGGVTWGRYSVGSTTDMNTIVFTEGRGFVAGNDGEARRFLGDAASDGSTSNGGNPLTGACTTPTVINVNGITDDQAVLNWTNGASETNWDVEYGVSPYTFTGTPTTTSNANQLTLTGLSSFTTYECKVRSNCGATNSAWSAITTFTTSTTNIDELAVAMKQFITYPVPSSNELNIETKFTAPTSFKIVLKDVKGVEVNELFNGTVSGNFKQTVDVSTLPSGIYFLHVNEGSKSYVRRIVVSQ